MSVESRAERPWAAKVSLVAGRRQCQRLRQGYRLCVVTGSKTPIPVAIPRAQLDLLAARLPVRLGDRERGRAPGEPWPRERWALPRVEISWRWAGSGSYPLDMSLDQRLEQELLLAYLADLTQDYYDLQELAGALHGQANYTGYLVRRLEVVGTSLSLLASALDPITLAGKGVAHVVKRLRRRKSRDRPRQVKATGWENFKARALRHADDALRRQAGRADRAGGGSRRRERLCGGERRPALSGSDPEPPPGRPQRRDQAPGRPSQALPPGQRARIVAGGRERVGRRGPCRCGSFVRVSPGQRPAPGGAQGADVSPDQGSDLGFPRRRAGRATHRARLRGPPLDRTNHHF